MESGVGEERKIAGKMKEMESGKKYSKESSFISRDLYVRAYMEKEKGGKRERERGKSSWRERERDLEFVEAEPGS